MRRPIKREDACRPVVLSDGRTAFRCIYCKKDFCTISDVNRHMDFHEGELQKRYSKIVDSVLELSSVIWSGLFTLNYSTCLNKNAELPKLPLLGWNFPILWPSSMPRSLWKLPLFIFAWFTLDECLWVRQLFVNRLRSTLKITMTVYYDNNSRQSVVNAACDEKLNKLARPACLWQQWTFLNIIQKTTG